jgi:hypothetical protein
LEAAQLLVARFGLFRDVASLAFPRKCNQLWNYYLQERALGSSLKAAERAELADLEAENELYVAAA